MINAKDFLGEMVELYMLKFQQTLKEKDIDELLKLVWSQDNVSKRKNKEISERSIHEMLLEELKQNIKNYQKLIEYTIKKIILETSRGSLPLTTLLNMIGDNITNCKISTRGKLAALITAVVQSTDLFKLGWGSKKTDGYDERIIMLSQNLPREVIEFLITKKWELPKEVPTIYKKDSKVPYAGHFKKHRGNNGVEKFFSILNKLNSVKYTVEPRVWHKYRERLAAYRFDDFSTQVAFLKEGDKLIGKNFYFSHRYGPDNGRIYCDGSLFTLQGGALNYIYRFADKRKLSAIGLKALKERIRELEEKLTKNGKLKLKEEIELYSLSIDLQDAEKGLPVGTILHIDAKLSGLQHQCIATRCKSEARYCGLLEDLEDGYTHLLNKLQDPVLTRDLVKDLFNPYQYGSGKLAMERKLRSMGSKLSYKEWESAYKETFPVAFKLRKLLLQVAKINKKEVITFTSPSGFECTITPLGLVETQVNTCYGNITFRRQEIDPEFFGVKLVAAFSHMQDAAVLHYIVHESDFNLSVVHDSFGAHPNDVDKVKKLYTQALQNHLAMPVLRKFLSEVTGEKQENISVLRYIENTLNITDIVGGLY